MTSSAEIPTQVGSLKAIARQAVDEWPTDQRFNAYAILERHPQLRSNRSIVLDLAYEEFCRQTEGGETVDPNEFVARFPSVAKSLRKQLEVHSYLDLDSSLWADERARDWPVVGEHFLGFWLQEEIGRGAFSRVFLAEQEDFNGRQVVVKICPLGSQEALHLGTLSHPHVMEAYAVPKDTGRRLAALCMPYLGRLTLHDVVQHAFGTGSAPRSCRSVATLLREAAQDAPIRETLPTDRQPFESSCRYETAIVRLGVQLADALAHAHSRHVLHCDVKPSNVLLTWDGRPMLLDFNLALRSELEAGAVGGTLPFMAPEQLRRLLGEPAMPVDARTDVFGLAATLAHLLTGRTPFGDEFARESQRGAIFTDALARRKAGQPELEGIERDLHRVLLGALAYDPADRPQSAREFGELLSMTLSRSRRLHRWFRQHAWTVGASVSAMCVAAWAWAILSPEPFRSLDIPPTTAASADSPLEKLLVTAQKAHRAGDFQTASERYRQLLGRWSGSGSVDGVPRLFVANSHGACLLANGDVNEAAVVVEQVLLADPENTTALRNRAAIAVLRILSASERPSAAEFFGSMMHLRRSLAVVENTDLRLAAAVLEAVAASPPPEVIASLREALRAGVEPQRLHLIGRMRPELAEDARFLSLLQGTAPPPSDESVAVSFWDPLCEETRTVSVPWPEYARAK